MRFFLSLAIGFLFFSCHEGPKIPDVSNIEIDLKTQRFEEELFKLDTNRLSPELDQLIAKYPGFGENFLGSILNTDPSWSTDTALLYIRGFIQSYKPIFDSTRKLYTDFTPYEKEVREGLAFFKYYFPGYELPKNLITYIGPLDGYGDILTEEALIVGLQHHMGKNFSLYRTSWVQETYPQYITARFEPDRIAVNCTKNLLSDLYPEKKDESSLLVQMIEKGKRLYLLSRVQPYTDEYKLIGYTEKQWKDCSAHEAAIWNLFIQNNLLQTIDQNIIKTYIGESPKTQELGEASPGNIGAFCGWQIVKKYMQKKPETSLKALMEKSPEMLFQETKYKP